MPELLTMQDLANGHLDVKALGEAANGDENTIVTTRTGNTYPSAERAINIMFQNGGLPATPFATKALMTASVLVDGKYAQVTDDTVNNGLYIKIAGAWVKSGYDPLGQSTDRADSDYNKIVGSSIGAIPPDSVVLTPAVSVTCVIGQPLERTSIFSFVGGSYTEPTTSIKVKVFNKVGANLVEADSATATYTAGKDLHTLNKSLTVNRGQYVGFYVVGGVARYKSGSNLPLIYATDSDVANVPITKSYTNVRYQFYLKGATGYVEQEVANRINPVLTDVNEVKQQVAALVGDKTYGLTSKPITDGVLATGNCLIVTEAVTYKSILDAVEVYCKTPSTGIVFFCAKKQSDTAYSVLFETAPIATTAGYSNIVFDIKREMPVGSFLGWYDVSRSITFATNTGSIPTVSYIACTKNGSSISTNATVYSGLPQIRFKTLRSNGGLSAVSITQADYDILAEKDPNTLYLVV